MCVGEMVTVEGDDEGWVMSLCVGEMVTVEGDEGWVMWVGEMVTGMMKGG